MLQYLSASSIPELGFLYQCSLTIPYTVQMNASFSQLSGCCPYTYCALLLVWPLAISPGLKTCSLLPMRSASTTLFAFTQSPSSPKENHSSVRRAWSVVQNSKDNKWKDSWFIEKINKLANLWIDWPRKKSQIINQKWNRKYNYKLLR